MEKIRRDVQNGEIDNKMKIQGLENHKQDSFHWKVRLGSSPILSIARNAGEDYSLMAHPMTQIRLSTSNMTMETCYHNEMIIEGIMW